ncbi:hypothetical protein [Gimesia sp.]|uniref:hypothetical protein n=1 Tax=Gimesia sp. TaxID=2024833 RepID=UPI0032EE9E78
MDYHPKDTREAQLLEHTLRSISFWTLACLIAGCFLGWPLLLALPVTLWGMWQFYFQTNED